VEWLCPPRFDAPSVFGAILDRSAGGFRLGPSAMGVPAGRRYEPGTMILETTWMTPTGWVLVRDALIIGPWRERTQGSTTAHTRPPTDYEAHHCLVRTITCIHGQAQIELLCEPMFDYGRIPATWSAVPNDPHALDATDGERALRLMSDLRAGSSARGTASRRARRGSAPCRGRACSTARAPPTRRWARSRSPRSTGAAGWPTPTSPTTAGATTSSAARSPSRG
jgi:GH15 family glucan-1,4-alpha-glucosidase